MKFETVLLQYLDFGVGHTVNCMRKFPYFAW